MFSSRTVNERTREIVHAAEIEPGSSSVFTGSCVARRRGMHTALACTSRNEAPALLVVEEAPMSKRIVLLDPLCYELFSGASVAGATERDFSKEEPVAQVEQTRDARQGGPLESGIFFRGSPRLKKTA